MIHWLAEVPLSPRAAALRRTMAPHEFVLVERSIENLALIAPERTLLDITERLFAAVDAMLTDQGPGLLLALLSDIVLRDGDR